eukprot:NP_001255063.1 Uncharacterized protein CELE_T16H12.1 [Caenorhabditis elegans]
MSMEQLAGACGELKRVVQQVMDQNQDLLKNRKKANLDKNRNIATKVANRFELSLNQPVHFSQTNPKSTPEPPCTSSSGAGDCHENLPADGYPIENDDGMGEPARMLGKIKKPRSRLECIFCKDSHTRSIVNCPNIRKISDRTNILIVQGRKIDNTEKQRKAKKTDVRVGRKFDALRNFIERNIEEVARDEPISEQKVNHRSEFSEQIIFGDYERGPTFLTGNLVSSGLSTFTMDSEVSNDSFGIPGTMPSPKYLVSPISNPTFSNKKTRLIRQCHQLHSRNCAYFVEMSIFQ